LRRNCDEKKEEEQECKERETQADDHDGRVLSLLLKGRHIDESLI